MTRIKNISLTVFLLTVFSLVYSCGYDKEQAVSFTNKKPEQYVSLDCQTGDITLTLNPDAKFNMTILYWDPKTNQHTGKDSLIGTWEKQDSILSLNILGNVLEYKYSTTKLEISNSEVNIPTYVLKYQEIRTFADSIDLLERDQTDDFLKKQMVK